MQYTVYLRRNLINGMQYVGQTGNFKKREINWRCLKWTYANDYLSDDREKYGLDNFTVEVLAETDSREDAWNLEQRFINDYNTIWPNGYNLDSGGYRGKRSDETKQKLSEANKGKPSPMYGKQLTDEHKQKISEAKKIPVYQYTKNEKLVSIWPSAKDAEEKLGIKRSNISACCRGKAKSAGDYIWSYKQLTPTVS